MGQTNHLVHLTEYFIVVQRAGCHDWMGEESDFGSGGTFLYLDLTILVNIRRIFHHYPQPGRMSNLFLSSRACTLPPSPIVIQRTLTSVQRFHYRVDSGRERVPYLALSDNLLKFYWLDTPCRIMRVILKRQSVSVIKFGDV